MPWFGAENNAEADSTLRLIGGLAIFTILIIGLFVGEYWFKKDYLSPELLHTIMATVGMWVVYQQGKRDGIASLNGNGHHSPQPPKPQTPRKDRLR